MAYNLEDGTPSFVIEVDFLKGEKGDTGFSPRIEIASLTSAEYILKVINEDGEFLTPNLKSDLSLDDYVLKEEGKGLSTNSFENEEKQKLQELHNYDDTELRSQVSGLAESIGKINSFDVKVVDELPTENIDVHTIYFVPNEQDDKNYYDEFLYVNSKWEHIGTSEVDLTGHVTKDDLGKTYTGTNITAPTVAGWGRIKKLSGVAINDVNLFDMNWLSTRVLPSAFTKLVDNKPITLEAGTYTFSNILDDGSYLNAQYMSVEYRDADGNSIKNSTVNGSFEITEEQASKIKTIQVNYNAVGHVGKTIKEMKLQKGSTKTLWSPCGYASVEVISKNGDNISSNICYVKDGLSEADYIDYALGKVGRADGSVEDVLNCSDKIVQYANNTNIYNRDGAEIEVSLTNNETVSGLNQQIHISKEVIVSDVEPVDKRKVWIKKGKNLDLSSAVKIADCNITNEGSIFSEVAGFDLYYIPCKPNTKYYIRTNNTTENNLVISSSDVLPAVGGTANARQVATKETYYTTRENDTYLIYRDAKTPYLSDLKIEEYVGRKIYVEDGNGGYDEIYNEKNRRYDVLKGQSSIGKDGLTITLPVNPVEQGYKFLVVRVFNNYARNFVVMIPFYAFEEFNNHYAVVSAINSNDLDLLRISPYFTEGNFRIDLAYDKYSTGLILKDVIGIY